MKISSIKKSAIAKTDLRVDASYHLSDGRLHHAIVEQNPYGNLPLKEVTERVFSGNIFKRLYVNNSEVGYHYLTASDMAKSDLESGKYISKKYTRQYKNLKIEKDWILLSCSGTLGNTAYTTKDFEKFVGTHDLIRILPDKNKIRSGYLYAFLTSKYGYSLLTQFGFGGVIKHIEPHNIENIPVPIVPDVLQDKIHNLIVLGSDLHVEANNLLKEAVGYFEKYDVETKTNVFSKRISQLNFSWASYNNNVECDNIENKISEHLQIKDVATKCFSPPLFKHIYLDKNNGHPFLTGAELTKFHKKFYRWLSPRGVKNINDYKVKKGTLLLYKSGTADGGILGNVFIADDILDDVCLSDHVIRIFTDDIAMAYWMFAFFKSKAGIKLLQKTATGSMIPFITPTRLLELKFPKPDSSFEIITEKIRSYIEKSVESQLCENKAIDLIEKEIEQWQQ